jgi:drug/metabolite transporter (DMT)-like permease
MASFSWGTSDFLAGVETRRSSAWGVAVVGQLVAAAGALVVAAALAPAPPSAGAIAVLALGGASSAVGVIAGYRALAVTKMSVVAPIIAGAAVVPVLWGVAGGERPGALQTVGVVAAVLGVVLISRADPRATEGERAVDRTGVLLAVVTALGMGGMLVALDSGGTGDPYWPVTVVRCSATLCIVAFVIATRPALRLRRSAAPLLLLVGGLILVANAAFAAATTRADLSIVGVLGWLGPAVIIVWARVLLHERLRPLQWLAAALVLAGVVCLALG